MRAILILLLLAMSATAQDQLFWMGTSLINPTNLPAAPATVQWLGRDYYTNGGVPTITNRLSGNIPLLNNSGATSSYPTAGTNLNGFGTLLLSDAVGTWLASGAFSASLPHSVVIVGFWGVANDSTLLNDSFWFDSTNSSHRNYFHERVGAPVGEVTAVIGAPNEVGNAGIAIASERWIVLQADFSSGTVSLYTNNVLFVTGNGGSDSMTGFTLAADNAQLNFGNLQIAEVLDYQTNLLTGAYRTNNMSWFRRFYNLP